MNLELFKTLTEEQRKRYGESLPFGFVNDENGNILTKRSTGYWYEYTRNKNGHWVTYKDSNGYWSECTRDEQGNELTYKDSDGCWYEYTRDKQGHQQADRIAELEKVSSKPVAWRFKEKIWWHYNDYGEGEPLYTHPVKQFNEEEFNAIAYRYRSWPLHDPKGVSERYQELLNYIKEITE